MRQRNKRDINTFFNVLDRDIFTDIDAGLRREHSQCILYNYIYIYNTLNLQYLRTANSQMKFINEQGI